MKLVFWIGILIVLSIIALLLYPHFNCMYVITHAQASLDSGVCW